MEWHERSYDDIDQRVFISQVTPLGPEIIVVPKPGFQRKYMTFSTRYGSNDRCFVPRGGTEAVSVPAGIAHFLEHQLFDQPDRNVLEELSALGVDPNAYTGHFYTVYLVSAVENWLEAFDRLLDFVQSPAFTDAGVKKEQGVIRQEIHMYKDHPTVRLREDLLRNLYHHHPVRDTILGEVADIMTIDTDKLFLCHRTFYHPSNMTVMVTGDVDPDQVWERVVKAIRLAPEDPAGQEAIRRLYPDEPLEVVRARSRITMSVSSSYAGIGLKLPPLVGYDARLDLTAQKRALEGEIALDALIGSATPLYQKLYADGIITQSFWYRLDVQPGVTYIEIGGQSDHPEQFITSLQAALREAARNGIDPEDVERSRRAAIGSILTALDSPETINAAVLRDRYLGFDFFEHVRLLREMDVSAAAGFFADAYREERLTVVTVQPAQEGAHAGSHGI